MLPIIVQLWKLHVRGVSSVTELHVVHHLNFNFIVSVNQSLKQAKETLDNYIRFVVFSNSPTICNKHNNKNLEPHSLTSKETSKGDTTSIIFICVWCCSVNH